jgi:hypothetical protein
VFLMQFEEELEKLNEKEMALHEKVESLSEDIKVLEREREDARLTIFSHIDANGVRRIARALSIDEEHVPVAISTGELPAARCFELLGMEMPSEVADVDAHAEAMTKRLDEMKEERKALAKDPPRTDVIDRSGAVKDGTGPPPLLPDLSRSTMNILRRALETTLRNAKLLPKDKEKIRAALNALGPQEKGEWADSQSGPPGSTGWTGSQGLQDPEAARKWISEMLAVTEDEEERQNLLVLEKIIG